MITRRGLLGGILSAACAPAIVRAASLMPIYVPKVETVKFDIWLEDLSPQFIRHVGSGFGMATVKREGEAIAYDPPFYNELGMVVGWDATQKLPPGWEFCRADGTLIEPEITAFEHRVNAAFMNHDVALLEQQQAQAAVKSSAGWKRPGRYDDGSPTLVELMAKARGMKL